MKVFITAFFLLLFTGKPVLNNKIQLKENQKVESTFSGNTSGENSFHLIITKNKSAKEYTITPYIYKEGSVTELKPINFDNKPDVLSFHNNENVISIVTKTKHQRHDVLNVIDIDTSLDIHLKSENIDVEDFTTLVRRKDRNILVFSVKASMTVLDAQNANNIIKTKVIPNEETKDFFKNMNKKGIQSVNNQEFVRNGSILQFKIYGEEDSLILTRKIGKINATQVVTVPLNGEQEIIVDSKTYKNGDSDFKKTTSYVTNKKLFQLKLDKKQVKLDIFSLTNEEKKTIDIAKIKTIKKASGFKDIKSFLRLAVQWSNVPTVTVNKTKKGNLKVRVDYIELGNYIYQHDWWAHHRVFEQQIWWQQQHFMRQAQKNLSKFGPSSEENIYSFGFIPKRTHFEFVLNRTDTIVPLDESETEFVDIDRIKYIDEIDNNRKLKYLSTVFTDTKIRYIAYNKKDKTFTINEKTLDD